MPTCISPNVESTVAVYLLNRMPSKGLNFKTPLHALSTHVSLPSALMLPPLVFGYEAYVHLHNNQCTKFDPCALWCLFLGYGIHQKGYRYCNPTTQWFYVTMDLQFLETGLFFSPSASTSLPHGEKHGEELNWFRLDGFASHDNEVGIRYGFQNKHDDSCGLNEHDDLSGPNDKSGPILSSEDSICPNVEPDICPSVPTPSVTEHEFPILQYPPTYFLRIFLR